MTMLYQFFQNADTNEMKDLEWTKHLCWYPSAFYDFYHIVELECSRILEPSRYPQLTYIFSDIIGIQERLTGKAVDSLPFDEGDCLAANSKGELKVSSCKKLTLKKCFENPSTEVVDFSSVPCVYLIVMEFSSDHFGKKITRKIPLIYFQYENLNLLVDFLLANQLHVHTLIHINDGGGSLGGSSIKMDFIYQVHKELQLKRIVSDRVNFGCGYFKTDVDFRVLLHQYQKSDNYMFRKFKEDDSFSREHYNSRNRFPPTTAGYRRISRFPDSYYEHFRIDTNSQEFRDLWLEIIPGYRFARIYELDKRTDEQKELDRLDLEEKKKQEEKMKTLEEEKRKRHEIERQRMQKICLKQYKKLRLQFNQTLSLPTNLSCKENSGRQRFYKWFKEYRKLRSQFNKIHIKLSRKEDLNKQRFDKYVKKRKVFFDLLDALRRHDTTAISALMKRGAVIHGKNNDGLSIVECDQQLGLEHLEGA